MDLLKKNKYQDFSYKDDVSLMIPKSLYDAGFRMVVQGETVDLHNRQRETKETDNIFYYHPRNVFRLGVLPNTVIKDNLLLWKMCSTRNFRTVKEDGLFYFLNRRSKARNRKKTERNSGLKNITIAYYEDMSNRYPGRFSFACHKPTTDFEITIKKIGISFVGVDGQQHIGEIPITWVDGRDTNVLPRDEGDFYVSGEGLIIKDFINHEQSKLNLDTPAGQSYFFGDAKSVYVDAEFSIGSGSHKVVFWFETNSDAQIFPTVKKIGTRKGKWRRLNLLWNYFGGPNGRLDHPYDGVGKFPRCFERRYLNVCKYTKKFKGVPSEFPEIFYTR